MARWNYGRPRRLQKPIDSNSRFDLDSGGVPNNSHKQNSSRESLADDEDEGSVRKQSGAWLLIVAACTPSQSTLLLSRDYVRFTLVPSHPEAHTSHCYGRA